MNISRVRLNTYVEYVTITVKKIVNKQVLIFHEDTIVNLYFVTGLFEKCNNFCSIIY